MINRTIAVALLAGLTSPVFAGAFASPTLDTLKGMEGGTSANAGFDGSASRAAMVDPVTGTPIGAMSASAAASPSKQSYAAEVRTPETTAPKKSFLKKISSKAGLIAVVGGAGIGFVFGGPIGAMIGAFVGFGIGFLISKVLHKKKH
jgi:hypothetical protein